MPAAARLQPTIGFKPGAPRSQGRSGGGGCAAFSSWPEARDALALSPAFAPCADARIARVWSRRACRIASACTDTAQSGCARRRPRAGWSARGRDFVAAACGSARRRGAGCRGGGACVIARGRPCRRWRIVLKALPDSPTLWVGASTGAVRDFMLSTPPPPTSPGWFSLSSQATVAAIAANINKPAAPTIHNCGRLSGLAAGGPAASAAPQSGCAACAPAPHPAAPASAAASAAAEGAASSLACAAMKAKVLSRSAMTLACDGSIAVGAGAGARVGAAVGALARAGRSCRSRPDVGPARSRRDRARGFADRRARASRAGQRGGVHGRAGWPARRPGRLRFRPLPARRRARSAALAAAHARPAHRTASRRVEQAAQLGHALRPLRGRVVQAGIECIQPVRRLAELGLRAAQALPHRGQRLEGLCRGRAGRRRGQLAADAEVQRRRQRVQVGPRPQRPVGGGLALLDRLEARLERRHHALRAVADQRRCARPRSRAASAGRPAAAGCCPAPPRACTQPSSCSASSAPSRRRARCAARARRALAASVAPMSPAASARGSSASPGRPCRGAAGCAATRSSDGCSQRASVCASSMKACRPSSKRCGVRARAQHDLGFGAAQRQCVGQVFLDRHMQLQRVVVGAIHHGEAALREHALDLELVQPRAGAAARARAREDGLAGRAVREVIEFACSHPPALNRRHAVANSAGGPITRGVLLRRRALSQRSGQNRRRDRRFVCWRPHVQRLRDDGRLQPQRQRGHPQRVRSGAAAVAAGRPGRAGRGAVRAAAGRLRQRRRPAAGPLLGFKSIPTTDQDTLVVPEGYEAVAFARLGRAGRRARQHAGVAKADASNSAADQAVQMGMHHDGIHYYPLDGSSTRGLLAMNHEYTDDGLLHPDGMKTWSAEKVRKAQAAHGVSVIEIELKDGALADGAAVEATRAASPPTRPSRVSGPAAGHALMKTAADPAGRTVLGTLNNCASGMTPWGTYLSGEENWAFYFDGPETPDADQTALGPAQDQLLPLARARRALRRQASTRTSSTASAGWWRSTRSTRPARRSSAPRSAAPRTKAPGSRSRRTAARWCTRARTRASSTSTSSSAATRSRPAAAADKAQANELLDHGTLYVARFDADGSGPLAAAGARPGAADRRQRLCRPGRGGDQEPPGQRPAGRARRWTGPSGWPSTRRRRGVLHAHQQQQPRRQGHARRRCRQPARQQRHGPDHPLDGGRRLRRAPRCAGTTCVLAGDPANERARGARQHPGRHLRLPRRPDARCARRAVGADRHARLADVQGRAACASATTRCWPATAAAARCGASSPAR